MSDGKLKGKFYPYIIAIAVSIYISTQIITLVSTANIGQTLQEVSQKQKSIFEFLMSQSVENASKISTYPNIVDIGINNKDGLLYFISFNNNIKIHDIAFFDLEGNLISDNYEGFTSFKSVFGNIVPRSILYPSIKNIRYSELYNEMVMDILIPVFDNGKLVAIMWQVESFERINAAMNNVSILSTGESYIIDSSGTVLTELKYVDINKSPVTIKESLILNNSFDGFEESSYLDYRDEPVYGYHTNLNLNQWKLIVEVDENEVVNTSKNINSFLASSITLILATSKLLEPMYKSLYARKKENIIDSEIEFNTLIKQCKNLFCKIKVYFFSLQIGIFYRKYGSLLKLVSLSLICISIIISIGRVRSDSDIQNNLDLANQVDVRLVSYYLNEVRSTFYAANRAVSEFDNINLNTYFSNTSSTSSNILNIVLLDSYNNIYLNSSHDNINMEYAKQAIEDNSILYNTTGISDIFFDENYDQYVFYLSGKILNRETDEWHNSIGVVSLDNLLNILFSNEMHSSQIITIVNEDKILYSNFYTIDEFPEEYYQNLRNIFSNDLYKNSIFNVNKYRNIDGIEVFGSQSPIVPDSVVVYGSYASISNTNWGLLYEEPVSIAKTRVYENSINLLLHTCYQYIQTIVQTIS